MPRADSTRVSLEKGSPPVALPALPSPRWSALRLGGVLYGVAVAAGLIAAGLDGAGVVVALGLPLLALAPYLRIIGGSEADAPSPAMIALVAAAAVIITFLPGLVSGRSPDVGFMLAACGCAAVVLVAWGESVRRR